MKNIKKISLCVMVPTVVISSNITANAMVGVRSLGNSIIGAAVKMMQLGSKSKGIIKGRPQDGIDHDLVARSINLFNKDKHGFVSLLAENPREIPLKEAMEVIKTPKISLEGYYYVKNENTFYPIVTEDNSPGPATKVPKGIVTRGGFKGKSTKDDNLFSVIEVESRGGVNVKNLDGTDETHEHVSALISKEFKNIHNKDNIGNYNENEKGLVKLAAKYAKDRYKFDLNKPEDFMARENTTHRNILTFFTAHFTNDDDPEFNKWLRENYSLVDPGVKKNLKLISEKLTNIKPKSDAGIATGVSSLSISQQDDKTREEYEAQGARPKGLEKKSK